MKSFRLSHSIAILVLCIVLCTLLPVVTAACGPIPSTSYCSRILPAGYIAASINPVNGTSDTVACPADLEDFPSVSIIPVIVGQTQNATLKLALAQFLCAQYYPPCDQPSLQPCLSTCNTITSIVNETINSPGGLDNTTNAGKDALLLTTTSIWQSIFQSGSCARYQSQSACNPNFSPAGSSVANLPLPRCEAYTGNVCKGIVTHVYIPPGLTQSAIESQVSVFSALYPLTPYNNHCATDLAKFACAKAFWPCYTTTADFAGANRTFLYPSPARLDVCEQYATSCASFIQTFTALDPVRATAIHPNCVNSTSSIGRRTRCDNTTVVGMKTYINSTTVTFPPGVVVSTQDYSPSTVQNMPPYVHTLPLHTTYCLSLFGCFTLFLLLYRIPPSPSSFLSIFIPISLLILL